MKKLTTEQYELIKKLCEDLGDNTTLGDILNRVDLNPYITEEVTLDHVVFEIKGILQYAYECTGEIKEYKGTIKEIIENEITCRNVFESENNSSNMIKLKDLWDNDEIIEFASFFLGYRDEPHLDIISAKANKEVSRQEIVDYLGELKVANDFTYSETVLEY